VSDPSNEKLWWRTGDICNSLGFSVRHFQNLRHRGQFPAPVGRVGRAHVWLRSAVEMFARGEWAPDGKSRRKAVAAK
jgi:hypothetical protein